MDNNCFIESSDFAYIRRCGVVGKDTEEFEGHSHLYHELYISISGKTKFVMVIDMVGTWVFGVPLGLLSAFVLKLSIPYVYFILSLEECVRFGISLVVLRKKEWMQSLEAETTA